MGLTTLPHSCADCLEIWDPQPPGTLRACPGIALPALLSQLQHCTHSTNNFMIVMKCSESDLKLLRF
jgi:hypothetical protein